MLKFTYKGEYLNKLKERVASWSSAKKVGMKITIPDNLHWVWYLEYGTRENGTAPYIIVPTGGNTKLVFFSQGGVHFQDLVIHPGIKAKHFIAQSLPDIRDLYELDILKVVDDQALLQEILLNIGEKAKTIIVSNLAAVTKSPNEKIQEHPLSTEFPNQGGRLHGEAASVVFEREAKVVKLNE